MAEQDDNWFGSWLSAAKDKSSKVFESMRKDLEEFGNAVKSEATNVVTTTGTVLEKTLKLDSPDSTASTMKRSFSSFLGQMNTVLNPSPDDSDTEAIMIMEDSETMTLTKLQRAVYDLQKSEDTFTKDPDADLSDKFQCWLEIIDDELSDERIDRQLKSSVILKHQHEKLVPDVVPHNLFWKRYLFKKAFLEDDIAHQEAMEKKEKKEKSMTEESLKWEQEDFAPYIELTEEEQIKLLEEYENEIKVNTTTGGGGGKRNSGDSGSDNTQKSPQSSPERRTKKVSKLESSGKKTKGKAAAVKSDNTSSSSSSTDGDWEKISDVEK